MSDYYYRKWRELLKELNKHAQQDLEYQATNAHDQTCCEAAQRLVGMLAKYMVIYNEGLICLQQNLQVQKTSFIEEVIHAVAARILELKNQLRKLESHRYQFFGNGLIQHLLTFDNIEPNDLLQKVKRSERLQAMIDEVVLRIEEKKETELQKLSTDENTLVVEHEQANIWDSDDDNEDDVKDYVCEVKQEISEESLRRSEMIKLIQAHERSRQVTRWDTERRFKRTMWEKELSGALKPQARFEIKERAARLIQNIFRAYFRIKRERMDHCKVDEILGIDICQKHIAMDKANDEQMLEQLNKKKYHILEWNINCDQVKAQYMRKVKDDMAEEHRDVIRSWFRKWYDEVNFFYNIPTEEQGGSALIIKKDVPTPSEWQEEYEAYLIEKRANKNKTSHQKKWEKLDAKREEFRIKREEFKKRKQEEALMKKIMKNPKMHPGFRYPVSKKTKDIINVIENYREHWKDIDFWEIEGYKEGFVRDVDKSNACMNTKMAIMTTVDDDMRQELKILKKALQEDYRINNEKMPEMIKRKIKRPKRKRKLKSTITESVQDKLEELVVAGILKNRLKKKFQEYMGEYNYAGDNLRCALQVAMPLGGEIKSLWWEKCNELFHGAQRFLLIGPQGCGKTTLVHILTTVNDAKLFELDPTDFPPDLMTREKLRQIAATVVTCARAIQPSVIHLKCLQMIYCKKAPPRENKKYLDMFKQYLIQNLLKKIRKNDMITVIGSCCDPWLTATNIMLKKFPDVVMLPDTTYPTASMILMNWKNDNRVVPRNLNLQSLAQVLRGYSYGYLKESLNSFLTPENIIRMAAYGLSPQELFEHVTRNGCEEKVDYEKYHLWYTENTTWGKKEEKRLNEDKEFKLLAKKFAEKEEKKKDNNKKDNKKDIDGESEESNSYTDI